MRATPSRVLTSLLARHEWFQQEVRGHAVYGGWWVRRTDLSTGKVTVWDGRRHIEGSVAAAPAVSTQRATSSAAKPGSTVTATAPLMVLADAEDGQARLARMVHSVSGTGVTLTFVDAVTGDVVKVVDVTREFRETGAPTARDDKAGPFDVTGRGRVFDPNPVAKLQNQSLRDRNDSPSAVPTSAYTTVNLRHMSRDRTLVGRWVRVTNPKRPTSSTNTYLFRRGAHSFEQVNAYYAIDRAQTYLRSQGIRGANSSQQRISTNLISDDNSFYDPFADSITMGAGGVDDGEDVEVIWHEYGHAIQDAQVPGFGQSVQAGSIGEAFGDYLAADLSATTATGTPRVPTACVADWDAVSYDPTPPHCLRRVDNNLTYPDDLTGQVHDDGRIWSRALWDIRSDLGSRKANRVIIEAHFFMHPSIGMPRAAQVTVSTAQRLYGASTARLVRQAFVDRGILETR